MITKERRGGLTVAILSLSLLTVMAGAAVAPALNTIHAYFSYANQALVQMIISVPALFIFLTNMIFPKLCRIFRAKELVLIGLALYIAGGCAAGFFSSIWLVLIIRAAVGCGVGIIMPLSTGLLSFYYTRDKQDRLMGYASAMNQLGGVIATLIAGMLAQITWRASFLVYLIGLVSAVPCVLFLPNEKIAGEKGAKEKGVFSRYSSYIIAMFLLMFSFFVYPSSFAMEMAKEGVVPMSLVSVIMAGMDLVALLGGLSFIHIRQHLGTGTRFAAPVLFVAGYALLELVGGWTGALLGSALVGFANGAGIPYLISTAGKAAGRNAATTVMPMLSMALYFAQFLTPLILAALGSIPPFAASLTSSVLFLIWSIRIHDDPDAPQPVRQENHHTI